MMQIVCRLLFVALCCSWNIAFAQPINQTDSLGRKQGTWVKKYPRSSVTQYQGNFKNDQPVGVFRYNYPSNKLKALIEHLPNSNKAKVEFYYENGQLMSKGNYLNIKKDSVWISFNEQGRVTMTETYKEDLLNGEKKIYHIPNNPNDKSLNVISLYHYVDGYADGEFVEYYSNGQLQKTGRFKNKQRNGLWVYYELNGNKMMEEHYYKGKKHGWQNGYNPQGQLAERHYFYHGERLEGDRLKRTLNDLKKQGISPNGGKLSDR